MLFIWHGSVLPQLLSRLLLFFAFSSLIVYLKGTLYWVVNSIFRFFLKK
jgi:ion channel-forming bestrophin family protein